METLSKLKVNDRSRNPEVSGKGEERGSHFIAGAKTIALSNMSPNVHRENA